MEATNPNAFVTSCVLRPGVDKTPAANRVTGRLSTTGQGSVLDPRREGTLCIDELRQEVPMEVLSTPPVAKRVPSGLNAHIQN